MTAFLAGVLVGFFGTGVLVVLTLVGASLFIPSAQPEDDEMWWDH